MSMTDMQCRTLPQQAVDGHRDATTHSQHRGFLATQTALPCKIKASEKGLQRSWGRSLIRSCSTRSGFPLSVSPSLADRRFTCLSTTTAGFPKKLPRITFAVFLPTPLSEVSPSIVSGTPSPYFSIMSLQHSIMLFAFCLKKPVERIFCSSSLWSAFAKSAAVLYLRKSSFVTMFTRTSVH